MKRLAFFTNIYLFLLALSVLVWLNKWDSEESTQDLTALIDLQNVMPLDLINLTPAINQKAAEWLIQNDTSEHNNVLDASIRFTRILDQYGINYLESYSPITDTSLHFNPKLHALFNVIPILSDSTILKFRGVLNKTPPSNALVGNLHKKATYMASEAKIQYVTAFDDALLKHKLDSLVFLDYAISHSVKIPSTKDSLIAIQKFSSRMQIGLAFNDTTLIILFLSKEAKSDLRSAFSAARILDIPVETRTSYSRPSMISLLDKEELNSLENMEVYTNFIRINENYADLVVSEAISHLSEESMRAYRSISIFGFEFSKRRLPWAFGFFCIVAAIGINSIVDEARKRNIKVLSEMNGDHIANMFIEDKWLRLMIWCITPLFIIYSSFPKLSLPGWDNIEYYVFIGVIVILTIRAFIRSLKA